MADLIHQHDCPQSGCDTIGLPLEKLLGIVGCKGRHHPERSCAKALAPLNIEVKFWEENNEPPDCVEFLTQLMSQPSSG